MNPQQADAMTAPVIPAGGADIGFYAGAPGDA